MASRKAKPVLHDSFSRIVGPCAESVTQYAAARAAMLTHAPELFESHLLVVICELADNSVRLPGPWARTVDQPQCTHATGPGQFVTTDAGVVLPLPWGNSKMIERDIRVRACKCGRRIRFYKDVYPVGREAAHFAYECGLWGCDKVVCASCFDSTRKQCAAHTYLVWKGGGNVKIGWSST